MGQSYGRMKDSKPGPGLVRNQDLVEGEGLQQKVKMLSTNIKIGKRGVTPRYLRRRFVKIRFGNI